jgi:hypothetical protein
VVEWVSGEDSLDKGAASGSTSTSTSLRRSFKKKKKSSPVIIEDEEILINNGYNDQNLSLLYDNRFKGIVGCRCRLIVVIKGLPNNLRIRDIRQLRNNY